MKRIHIHLTDDSGRTLLVKASSVAPSVSVSTDDFEQVVGTENSRYPTIASDVMVAATPENSAFLLGATLPQSGKALCRNFRCVITVNSLPYFTGTASLNLFSRGKAPERFVLKLNDEQGDFWQVCGATSLRALDIGQFEVTAESIIESWGESIDTGWLVNFVPAIYGQPTGTYKANPFIVEPRAAFHARDFRPSVYFPAIFDAIERLTGYTFVSEFFQLPIFKDHVYLYRIEDSDLRDAVPPVCYFEANVSPNSYPNESILSWQDTLFSCGDDFAEWNGDIYEVLEDHTFDFQIWIEGSSIHSIVLEKEGLDNPGVWYTFFAWNIVVNDRVEGAGTFSVLAGEKLRVKIYTLDDGHPETPTWYDANITAGYLRGDIEKTGFGLLGRTLYIESFLHDKPVRDFMRGVSHQFCLAWLVDPQTRRVFVEPRFDYYIEGVKYAGFYGVSRSKLPGNLQGITYQREDYFGRSLELCFIQEGGVRFELRNDGDGFPVEGTRYMMPSGKVQAARNVNPFWQVLTQFSGSGFDVITYLLPALMEDDWQPGQPLPQGDWQAGQMLPPNYSTKGNPTCALLQRGNAYIHYDNGNDLVDSVGYAVPWACQYIERALPNGTPLEKPYCGSFSDSKARLSGQENEILPGLSSMFYLTYLATVECPEEMRLSANIKPLFVAQLPFRQLFTVGQPHNTGEWLLLQIEGFNPSFSALTSISMLKKIQPTLAELFKLQQWRFNYFTPADDVCNELAVDESEGSEISRDVVGIQNSIGWTLPLRYPYIGSVAGEALRLQRDIEAVLMYSDIQFSTVTVIMAFVSGIERWTIEIKDTTASFLYLRLDLNDGEGSLRLNFTRDC
jgi:hypothetical protein